MKAIALWLWNADPMDLVLAAAVVVFVIWPCLLED